MRIVLAQIDTTVGDITGNAQRAVDALVKARDAGADLVLLPELALTGYPPEDLLHKGHFVDDNLAALEAVARAATRTAVIGFVDREGDALYNAAALIQDGRVQRVYRKRRLPNYGVFDERRYFAAGEGSSMSEVGGTLTALTVCEDIWVPDLASEAGLGGAGLLVNISASPFHAGKGAERERMLVARARDNGLWLAYCNLVGGQDELVFDGRSVIVSPEGDVVARGASFAEDFVVADVGPDLDAATAARSAAPLLDGPAEIYCALESGLADYVRKNGFTDVVLGLSGGIDSALTAAIAADALGPERVHGVLMPSRFSSQGSVDDSLELAQRLGLDARTIPIERPHQAFLDALHDSFAGTRPDVAEENIQARVRGTLLMALSNKFGWLTLATGNKSELSVGYSTLYGDMVGGFAPIKDVFKTRVYELARWRNQQSGGPVIPEEIIDKPPSAELRPDQFDADSLPPYDVLDAILERYVELDKSHDEIVADGFEAAIVARVIELTDGAEYKRRQGPLGVKITPKAFGKDRRMPVTNRYRG